MEKDSHPPAGLPSSNAYPPQAPQAYPPPQQVGYPAPPPAGYPAGPAMQQGYQPLIQEPPQPETQQPGFPPQQYGYPPVQQQPGSFQQQPGPSQPGGWMVAPPAAPSNCPPGLEYLTQIDQLLIKQQIEVLEAITGFETNNKYKVQNSLGQQVYFASEDTDCCTRNICGPSRPFDIQIEDNMNREVIHLTRPLRCSACCFPCCLQELEVQSPPGTAIGYVEQMWSICIPKFAITTPTHETILQIEGPFFQCNMCGDVEYKLLSADGATEVGKISKQWSGLLKEAFTDADNFGISFPMDLDVKVKATVLGAAFLIDFMFFEESANQNNNNGY